ITRPMGERGMEKPVANSRSDELRLAHLENELARLKNGARRYQLIAFLLLCVMGGGCLLAAANDPAPQEITVKSLKMVDAKGKVRAELGLKKDSCVSLVLYDTASVHRLALAADDDTASVILLDSSGIPRAYLQDTKDRSTSLVLNNEKGKGLVSLGTADGGGGMMCWDGKGNTRFGCGADGKASFVYLHDFDGERRAAVYCAANGTGAEFRNEDGKSGISLFAKSTNVGLSLSDNNARKRINLELLKNVNPQFQMLDEQDKL